MPQLLLQNFTRKNIQTFLVCLIAISLCWTREDPPAHFILSNLSSKLTVLFIIFYLVDKNLLQKIKNILHQQWTLFFISIFLYYTIGLLWSADFKNGLATLLLKLPFLIFPIILSTEYLLDRIDLERIMFAFCISCLCVLFTLECIAVYRYFNSHPHNNHYLFYQLLAIYIMNPTHLSNFFVLAVFWLSLPIIGYQTKYTFSNPLRIIMIILFVLFIAQLTVKTAFIILLMYSIWFLIKIFQSNFSKQLKLKLFTFITIAFIAMIIVVKSFLWARFSEMFTLQKITNNVGFEQSTMSRIAAVQEAFLKGKTVWYKGYGTGMANNKLMEQFIQEDFKSLVKNKMVCHNQYMHTYLDIGLFGVLFFIALTFFSINYFKNQKEYFGICLMILILFSCLTYDMLEFQVGVVPFLFLWSLFLFQKKNI